MSSINLWRCILFIFEIIYLTGYWSWWNIILVRTEKKIIKEFCRLFLSLLRHVVYNSAFFVFNFSNFSIEFVCFSVVYFIYSFFCPFSHSLSLSLLKIACPLQTQSVIWKREWKIPWGWQNEDEADPVFFY